MAFMSKNTTKIQLAFSLLLNVSFCLIIYIQFINRIETFDVKISTEYHSNGNQDIGTEYNLNIEDSNGLKRFIHKIMSNEDSNRTEFYLLLTSHLNKNVMSPNYNIIVYSIKTQRMVLYHTNLDIGGLGNNLYSYWWCRALAFYLNLEFQFVINTKEGINNLPNTSDYIKSILLKYLYGKHKYDQRWMDAMNIISNGCNGCNSNHSVSNFIFLLPTYSNYTFLKYMMDLMKNSNINPSLLINEYNTINMYLISQILSISSHKYINHELMDNINIFRTDEGEHIQKAINYPWGEQWRMLYLNDIFREKVISSETYHVLNEYHDLLNIGNIQVYNKNDIVIHIRCGDVLYAGRTYSGFQTFNFYRNSLEYIRLKNNNFIESKKLNKNVYILLKVHTLNDAKRLNHLNIDLKRAEELLENEKKCQIFSDIIIPKMQQFVFNKYNYRVHLISNGSLHDDIWRLIKAPNLICSTSTLCTSLSLTNINANIIIWPNTNNINQYNDNYSHLNNIKLIDNKWISSSDIKKYKYTPQQIAKYVINH